MVAIVPAVTVVVVTVNVAVVAPAATVTEVGTLAAGLVARQHHHRTARRRRGTKRDGTGAIRGRPSGCPDSA